jgi:serine O-acetyltransferase
MSLFMDDMRAKARWCNCSLARALFWDGTFATMIYRMSQWCYRHRLGLLGAFLNQLNPILTHAVIGREAKFGPGFVILHSIGLVINTGVRGGANIILENGVTIGAEKGQAPVLGSNIYVGSGARIIGGVQIGNNIRIGANAVVVKDIPDNATAVGVPAQVVKPHEG